MSQFASAELTPNFQGVAIGVVSSLTCRAYEISTSTIDNEFVDEINNLVIWLVRKHSRRVVLHKASPSTTGSCPALRSDHFIHAVAGCRNIAPFFSAVALTQLRPQGSVTQVERVAPGQAHRWCWADRADSCDVPETFSRRLPHSVYGVIICSNPEAMHHQTQIVSGR
jgi:hypothetical protein